MAVTRIWSIKGNVGDVISYAADKDKTDLKNFSEEKQALIRSLHYAENEEKTEIKGEQKLLVEGINCDPDIAAEQMMNTKELYGKTGGIVAYHGYISFKPDEVEPKEAQKIAMEIADKMWGKDYEVIVATHMNAHCVHCHIVINSVSMTDGRKMNENKAMYRKFRQLSDEICLEHGLSVIEKPKGKRIPYNVYKAHQKGIKTKYDYMKEDIDFAITHCLGEKDFFIILSQKGYAFENFYDSNRYATVRYKTDKHGVRLVNLGEEYTPAAIRYRVKNRIRHEAAAEYYKYFYSESSAKKALLTFRFYGGEFYESSYTYENDYALKRTVENTMKAVTGCVLAGCPVIALLFLALLFTGVLLDERNRSMHPRSPKMRLSKPRTEFISKQMDLALKEKLYTFNDVEKFIVKTGAEFENLKYERSKIYNRIRRCTDPELKVKLIEERSRLTGIIIEKRNDLNIANRIISDSSDLEAREQCEIQAMREWYFPTRAEIPTPPKVRNKNELER